MYLQNYILCVRLNLIALARGQQSRVFFVDAYKCTCLLVNKQQYERTGISYEHDRFAVFALEQSVAVFVEPLHMFFASFPSSSKCSYDINKERVR